MKISFFHLMPYQGLPSDFETRFRSAWVDLPNENFDPQICQQYFDDYLTNWNLLIKWGLMVFV
ncbi:MAG: hypothetical protein Ct9H300mP27_10330 [Chloroflexota bacterium]|nr:MAG: hypothetical protein Ct9H300mP27_10330 [Chloroflexota bacterium]